jgi:hypothetical protein
MASWYPPSPFPPFTLLSVGLRRLQHMRGAANIVRQHHTNLLKTPTGKQLLHLFGRLELSASRHLLIPDQTAPTSDTAFFDSVPDVPLSLEDWTNGTGDFELAWTRMMKIMVPVTVLRMVPRQGDKGTRERKVEGERIQGLLTEWGKSLPGSFAESEGPEMMMILDDEPVLQQLQPLYYSSYNVAVAMAHHSALQINVFTLTHRGDEEKPEWFFDAVERTLRICLGVQRMRQLGLYHIPEGGDYGILWPFAIAAIRVPRGDLRTWIVELLTSWPREGMIVLPPTCLFFGSFGWLSGETNGGRTLWMCMFGLIRCGHG